MFSKSTSYPLFLVALLLTDHTNTLLAETSEPSNDGNEPVGVISNIELEPVILTARKREEQSIEIPVQVSLIDNSTIDQARVLNVNDLDFLIPSLTHVDPGNPIESFPIIRGVGSTYNIGEFSVGLFTDGIYHGADNYFSQDQLDVERIEVLKGPQTTLYGKSAIGGAISVHTRQPTMQPEYRSETTVGEHRFFQQRLIANLPAPEKQIAFRIAYDYKTFDGFYQNPFTGKPRDEESLHHLRVKTLYEASDRLEFTSTLSYRRLDADSYAYHRVADDRDYRGEPYSVNFPPRAEIDVIKLSLHGKLKLNDIWELHSITAGSVIDQDDNIDVDYSGALPTASSPAADLRAIRRNSRSDFSQEFRFDFAPDSPVTGQSGLYFFWLEDNLDQRVFFESPVAIPGPPPTLADRDAFTLSAYTQLDWDITSQLTLSPAIRYDHEIRELNDRFLSLETSRNFDIVSPTLSLSFKASPTSLIYVRTAIGARSGGLNVGGLAPFNREDSTSYEIGSKHTFADNRAGLNSAVFWTDISDRQVNELDTATVTEFVSNQGEVRIYGAELESYVNITPNLQFSLAATALDAEYRNFSGTTIGPGGGVGTFQFDGNTVPYVPDYEFRATLNYRVPFGRSKTFFARSDFRHSGQRFWNEFNLDRQEAYSRLNFRLGIESKNMELIAFVENALDEDYFTNYVPSFRFPFSGSALGVNGDPRFYGLKLTLKF